MATVKFFPSIHDNTAENKRIWAPLYLIKTQLSSSANSLNEDLNAGASQVKTASSLQVEAEGPGQMFGCWTVSDYRPLDVFGVTAEDPGSASWSEEDEMCELYIRMKEIELCNMMRDSPGVPLCKQTMILTTCAATGEHDGLKESAESDVPATMMLTCMQEHF